MRRIVTRGLVAAMEQEELAATAAVAPAPQPVSDSPIIDHSETVETGLLEVSDNESAAAQLQDQTEEAAEVATALESMAESLRAAAGNGGLSKDAAHAVNIATEHLMRRVGIDTTKRTMPALESYGTVQSRVVATQLAMESMANTARKIWYAIVDAIKKSIAWLVDRWNSFFDVAKKLKERADKLAAKAEGVGAKEPKVKELDNSGYVSALHVGGKIENLPGHIETVSKLVGAEFGGVAKRMEAFTKGVEAKEAGAVGAAVSVLQEHSADMSLVTNPEAEGIRKPLEGVTVLRSPELPGGKALIQEEMKAEKNDDADAMVKALNASKQYLGDFSNKTKPADGAKMPVLSPADLAKLAKTVSGLADTLQKFNEGSKKIADEKKKLVEKAEELAKKADDSKPAAGGEKKEGEAAKPAEAAAPDTAAETPDEEAKMGKVYRALLMALGRNIDSPIAGLSVYSLNTGKKALDYITTALEEAYEVKVEGGEGKKEDKPAEAAKAAEAAKPADGAAAAA